MIMDASEAAGFPLEFDIESGQVKAGGGFAFDRKSRSARELNEILRYPDCASGDAEMYATFPLLDAPAHASQLLNARSLTYSLVYMPAAACGGELPKTAGHFHSSMPGASVGYPEVYTQLSGTLLLYLQRQNRNDVMKAEDAVLIEMAPSESVLVPPDYAHILVNHTGEPALMAGLYSTEFSTDYTVVKQHRGLSYYFMYETGGFKVEANPQYANTPPLAVLKSNRGTLFDPPAPMRPLLSDFLARPEAYAFLHDAKALRESGLIETMNQRR